MACRLGEQERVRLRGLLVERGTLLAERDIALADAQVNNLKGSKDFHLKAKARIWH